MAAVGHHLIEVADGLYNIRGSFRLFGLLDIGTHCTLARLASGRFVMIDGYTLEGEVREQVLRITGGGALLEAVIHVHPFHTVHVAPVAKMFPDAKLYGTARHHARFGDLPWQPERVEDPAMAAIYPDDLELLVPRGVAFIPKDERLHFASVLVIHRASQTLHVDDTLTWLPWPFSRLAFHPTLKQVLEPRPEAADELRAWAEELAARCETIEHVCTAHSRYVDLSKDPPGGIARRVREALARVEPVLTAHARR